MTEVNEKSIPVTQASENREYGDDSSSSRSMFYNHGVSMLFMHHQAFGCPAWWSPAFDQYMRNVVRSNSYIASAHWNVVSKLSAIQWQILPEDMSVTRRVSTAQSMEEIFLNGSPAIEHSEGWYDVKDRFIDSLLSQANPGILEILDSPDNIGRASSTQRIGFGGFKYWDSTQVVRKNNLRHPISIKYDGEQYKLHKSRFIELIEHPSGNPLHNRIGYPSTARALYFFKEAENVTLTLNEYFGDAKPNQVIMLAANGIAEGYLADQFGGALEQARNLNRANVGVNVYLEAEQGAKLDLLRLRVLPEDFKPDEAILRAMEGIASAYRVDLREVWNKSHHGLGGVGDSQVADVKTRQKLVAWYMQNFKAQIEQKLLPSWAKIVRVGHESEASERNARAKKENAEADEKSLADGTKDVRTVREGMLERGELSVSQFNWLELEDGRLPDGNSVLEKVYADDFDVMFGPYVGLGFDPLKVDEIEIGNALVAVRDQMADLMRVKASVSGRNQKLMVDIALRIMRELDTIYDGEDLESEADDG